MEKRTLLWSLGLIAFGFTYLAASNISEVYSTGLLSFTRCRTFDPFEWFSSECSDLLFERLGVLAIGGAVLLVCGYFAEKKPTDADRGPTHLHAPSARRPPVPQRPELPQPPPPEFKTCPDCAEQVRAAARKCRFCGYEFNNLPSA